MSIHGNWNVILRLERIQRKVIKSNKKVKDYHYKKRLKKLGLTILLESRMEGDLIETFKVVRFLVMVDIFLKFLLEQEIYCPDRFKN